MKLFRSNIKEDIFNDWRVCDRYKDSLFHEVDFWLDTHIAGQPKMIDRETFFKGIEKHLRNLSVLFLSLIRRHGEDNG